MRQAGGSTHLTPLLASQQQVSQPLDESLRTGCDPGGDTENPAYSGTPQSNTRPPEQHSAPELGPQYTWPDSCKPIPAGSFGNPTDPTNFTYDMSSDMAQVPEGKIAVVVVTKPGGRLLGEGESIVIDDRARATVTTYIERLQLSARQGGGAAWGDAGTEQGYGYAVLCVRHVGQEGGFRN